MTSAVPVLHLLTERLLLRELRNSDLPALKAILQDDVTMTAYEGSFSDDEVQAWLEKQLCSYQEYGFGLWAVELRDTGMVIGQCGITWQDIAGERVLEVGYLFNKAYWHHGYAVEAAKACRDWAFDHLQAKVVFAQVRDTNIASMNVAIRLGMTIQARFTKHYRGIEMPHLAFSITNNKLQKNDSN